MRLDRRVEETRILVGNARSTIEEGDAGMPEWRGTLSPREIALLARYVAAAGNRPTRSPDDRPGTLTPRPDPTRIRPPAERFADGKALFREICAGCHTLADAGAHGSRFDLDAALAPMTDKVAVVREAMKESNAMPDWHWRLEPAELEAIVRYVSTVAGRGQ
jgi:mono/diheme cytochrome c family protein